MDSDKPLVLEIPELSTRGSPGYIYLTKSFNGDAGINLFKHILNNIVLSEFHIRFERVRAQVPACNTVSEVVFVHSLRCVLVLWVESG